MNQPTNKHDGSQYLLAEVNHKIISNIFNKITDGSTVNAVMIYM